MSSDKPVAAGADSSASARRPRSVWLPLVIGLAGLVGTVVLFTQSTQRLGNDGPGIGLPAPTIELVQLTENESREFQTRTTPNRVALLHLWGTWCGPCRMEYPHLDEMVRELKTEGPLDFFSISCESGSETMQGLTKKTRDYLQSIQADPTAYADPNGTTRQSLLKKLHQNNIYYPTTVLVDQQGAISGVWQGYDPEGVDQIRDAIRGLWANH